MCSFNTKGKRTYNVSDVIVGDIVKFKGTRNGGIRRILEIKISHKWLEYGIDMYQDINCFCRVLTAKMWVFKEEPYTSTNNVSKLSHVFRDGDWFKVI